MDKQTSALEAEVRVWKERALRAESDSESYRKARDNYLAIIFTTLEGLREQPEALEVAAHAFEYGPGSMLAK